MMSSIYDAHKGPSGHDASPPLVVVVVVIIMH